MQKQISKNVVCSYQTISEKGKNDKWVRLWKQAGAMCNAYYYFSNTWSTFLRVENRAGHEYTEC